MISSGSPTSTRTCRLCADDRAEFFRTCTRIGTTRPSDVAHRTPVSGLSVKGGTAEPWCGGSPRLPNLHEAEVGSGDHDLNRLGVLL